MQRTHTAAVPTSQPSTSDPTQSKKRPKPARLNGSAAAPEAAPSAGAMGVPVAVTEGMEARAAAPLPAGIIEGERSRAR